MVSVKERVNVNFKVNGVTSDEIRERLMSKIVTDVIMHLRRPCLITLPQNEPYKGWVLGFSTDYEEFESGPGPFPIAIVEDETGRLFSVYVKYVRMLDTPEHPNQHQAGAPEKAEMTPKPVVTHNGVTRDMVIDAFDRAGIVTGNVEVYPQQIDVHIPGGKKILFRGQVVEVVNSNEIETSLLWDQWIKITSKRLIQRGIDPQWWKIAEKAIKEVNQSMQIPESV